MWWTLALWWHWPLWLMEDRVPGFSLRSQQQSSQQRGQQTIINAVICVFTLLSTAAYTQTNAIPSIKSLNSVFEITHKISWNNIKTLFNVGCNYNPRVSNSSQASCCGRGPRGVDISVQMQRDASHAHSDIHPSLSLCKIKPRSVWLYKPQWEHLIIFFNIWNPLLFPALSVDLRISYSLFHTVAWRVTKWFVWCNLFH